jgi:hypothetical protein
LTARCCVWPVGSGSRCRPTGSRCRPNRKTPEGAEHPDRDAQFWYIDRVANAALAAAEPVISVDTKKKELVGNFKAVGRERTRKGQPVKVNTHDFPSFAGGEAVPYGVLDIALDEGHVSVGVSADTAQFAAASILAWWQQLGAERYPHASTLTITADSGGSNSSRRRLWKTEVQRLADLTGLEICVLITCPVPASGTGSSTSCLARSASTGAGGR